MARSRLPAWVVFLSASVALAQPGGFGKHDERDGFGIGQLQQGCD